MRFAAPLFRALVASWLDAARRQGAKAVIACAEEDRDALASIVPDIDRDWIEQRGDTFGQRVAHATGDAFARGFDVVLVAAIDAPPHGLSEAFARLAEGTPVLSPSRDGGINFIGLVQPEPELLAQLEIHNRAQLALFPTFHILRATIDVDNESALAIARTDRAWRAFILQRITPRSRNQSVALFDDIPSTSPRAPPAS